MQFRCETATYIWVKVSRTVINAVAKREGDKVKKFGIWLIAVMLGLVLACGSQEAKAPAKPATPPEKVGKAAPQAPPAQVARMEIHSFQSMTLTDQEFLTGRKGGKPVTIAGLPWRAGAG